MAKYNPKEIEAKWQKKWEENKTFEVKEDKSKPKFYSLIEFPYPSGAGLHVGHPRPFTAMDIISRKKRMEGFNVLYPIGFDAFGLPTENYAIKTGRPPAEVTAENIANFTRQLKSLGYSFDWSRAVDTTDPKYFKWTQWIFLQFYKHGLAYKKNQPINWCPKDKIGLANEEVVNGACERCGTPVEKRNKEQWMLAITKYADKLLEGLKEVNYITPARIQQENWIGRSEGAEIIFKLRMVPGQADDKHSVTVFTTRPDTIFGATFLAVSADLAKKWIEIGWQADVKVKKYVEATLSEQKVLDREEKEKTGINAGITAVNPVTGEEIPVWITNYVMGGVGTGAIMAVPAHDERDYEFAKKFNLPIKIVVVKKVGERLPDPVRRDAVFGVVRFKGKILIGLEKERSIYRLPGGGYEEGETDEQVVAREVREETGFSHFTIGESLGVIEANYHYVTKNVNRHRYSKGFIIDLVDETRVEQSTEDKGFWDFEWVTVDEAIKKFESNVTNLGEIEFLKRLKNPAELCFTEVGTAINSDFLNGLSTPEAKEKMITWLEEQGVGKRKVNYKLRDWVFSRQRYWGEPIPLVHCEACAGWIPLPESELPLTLPKVEKYEPTDTGESPLAAMTDWVKTTCPKCGGPARRETDTMPNWAGSSWYFLRYTDPNNDKAFASEEVLKYWMPVDWYNGGMEHTVLHLLYSRFWNQFLYDIGVVPTREPYKKRTSHGMILGPDGEKMSKSRGNVINPDEMVEQFGTDAFRGYIAFMGPFDQAVKWDTNGLAGVRRFLDKVWNLQERIVIASEAKQSPDSSESSQGIATSPSAPRNDKLTSLLHRTIKKVTDDIDTMGFNTAIAKLMELVNEMSKEEAISKEQYQVLIKLLSPFAPHIAEELWETYGDGSSLAYSTWPQFDAELAKESTLTIPVQINGKVREQIEIAAEAGEEDVKSLALASEKVQKWLEGKEPKKVIYVKGKLVSVVI